jgi:hypothetical protein
MTGTSIEFLDRANNRITKYVYPDANTPWAGWLLYQKDDGTWVSYRKATPEDVESINEAVVRAHHSPYNTSMEDN